MANSQVGPSSYVCSLSDKRSRLVLSVDCCITCLIYHGRGVRRGNMTEVRSANLQSLASRYIVQNWQCILNYAYQDLLSIHVSSMVTIYSYLFKYKVDKLKFLLCWLSGIWAISQITVGNITLIVLLFAHIIQVAA